MTNARRRAAATRALVGILTITAAVGAAAPIAHADDLPLVLPDGWASTPVDMPKVIHTTLRSDFPAYDLCWSSHTAEARNRLAYHFISGFDGPERVYILKVAGLLPQWEPLNTGVLEDMHGNAIPRSTLDRMRNRYEQDISEALADVMRIVRKSRPDARLSVTSFQPIARPDYVIDRYPDLTREFSIIGPSSLSPVRAPQANRRHDRLSELFGESLVDWAVENDMPLVFPEDGDGYTMLETVERDEWNFVVAAPSDDPILATPEEWADNGSVASLVPIEPQDAPATDPEGRFEADNNTFAPNPPTNGGSTNNWSGSDDTSPNDPPRDDSSSPAWQAFEPDAPNDNDFTNPDAGDTFGGGAEGFTPTAGGNDDGGTEPGDPPNGGSRLMPAGDGFTGDATPLSPVGHPNDFGYDAQAIARWNVVPHQDIDGMFNVGVVAFHINGIEHVEFVLEGGDPVVVDTMTRNPRTDTVEYWATIDTSTLDPGETIELRATAKPMDAGGYRVLAGDDDPVDGSLFLIVDDGQTPDRLYVSPSGSDDNDGSYSSPFKSIDVAMRAADRGDEIILRDEGFYKYGWPGKHNVPKAPDGKFALTIRGADGLNRDNIVIGQSSPKPIRAYTKIQYKNVSFDFATVDQFYEGEPWFDNCRFFHSDGMTGDERLTPVRGPWFVTNSEAHDKLYAFPGATLVRNVEARDISGDVFQNASMVVNADVHNVDGKALGHHTDLIQFFGPYDNVVYYDIHATQLDGTQAMFIEPTWQSGDGSPRHYLRNAAFVNIDMMNVPTYYDDGTIRGGPPFSQMMSRFEHVIFRNIQLPNQRFLLRTDVDSNQEFFAKYLHFENAWLFPDSFNNLQNHTPNGVTVENLSASNGEEASFR